MRRGLSIASVVLVVVAACGQSPEPSPTGLPFLVEGRDAGFAMSMRLGSDVVDAGAPIDLSAVLMWEGANPTATIWGSGMGPVSFGLTQIDGDIALGGIMTADCGPHEFKRLVPVAVPYRKSGGWTDEDPNADFYRSFFADPNDPVLRLPAGQWRVTAMASGYLQPCEMNAPAVDIKLEANLLVR
jgi:hypothetical protein